MQTHAFDISGMTCDHCVRAVKKALEGVPGVRRADVRVGHADVESEDTVRKDLLVTAIEEEGYQVRGR